MSETSHIKLSEELKLYLFNKYTQGVATYTIHRPIGHQVGYLEITIENNEVKALIVLPEDKMRDKIIDACFEWLKYTYQKYPVITIYNDGGYKFKKTITKDENEYPLIWKKMHEEMIKTENSLIATNKSYREIIDNNNNYIQWTPLKHSKNSSNIYFYPTGKIILKINGFEMNLNVKCPQTITITKGRKKEKIRIDYSLTYNNSEKCLVINTTNSSFTYILDKENKIMRFHISMNVKRHNNLTKGSYHFGFNPLNGWEFYYTSRDGKIFGLENLNRNITRENPETYDLMNTRPITIDNVKKLISLFFNKVKDIELAKENYINMDANHLETVFPINEIKEIISEIPISIIQDLLKDLCFTFSPKKKQDYKRVRKN